MALLDRVQAVMLKPKLAWPTISAEPDTTQNILTSYVLPLVAFAAICRGLGLLFVMAMLGFGLVYVIATIIVGLIVGIASIYITAQVIDALAPSFGAMKNPLQSMKVAAYSYTPAAVGSVFALIPIAGGLLTLLVSLYCIYEMYLGLITTMGAPKEKAVGYTAVAIIVAFIVIAILSVLLGLAIAPFGPHIVVPRFAPTTP